MGSTSNICNTWMGATPDVCTRCLRARGGTVRPRMSEDVSGNAQIHALQIICYTSVLHTTMNYCSDLLGYDYVQLINFRINSGGEP